MTAGGPWRAVAAGLSPWEFEFPFPGSLTSTFLAAGTGPWRAVAAEQARRHRGEARGHYREGFRAGLRPSRRYRATSLERGTPVVSVRERWRACVCVAPCNC